jgi:L-lactate dehydrogenase (cytochrome)
MDPSELSNHRTKESCWITIDGNIYDVTTFADIHPGGPAVILKYAGHVGTAEAMVLEALLIELS